MKPSKTATAILVMLTLAMTPSSVTASVESRSAHEDFIVRFLNAFVAYDYDTCHSLLAADATIATARRYKDGPYRHVFQTKDEWLDSVRESGITGLEDFSVEIHETTSLVHEHGATVMIRFTSSGGSEGRVFRGLGIDTASLIETQDGWRILHYSSFEEFQWSDAQIVPTLVPKPRSTTATHDELPRQQIDH